MIMVNIIYIRWYKIIFKYEKGNEGIEEFVVK